MQDRNTNEKNTCFKLSFHSDKVSDLATYINSVLSSIGTHTAQHPADRLFKYNESYIFSPSCEVVSKPRTVDPPSDGEDRTSYDLYLNELSKYNASKLHKDRNVQLMKSYYQNCDEIISKMHLHLCEDAKNKLRESESYRESVEQSEPNKVFTAICNEYEYSRFSANPIMAVAKLMKSVASISQGEKEKLVNYIFRFNQVFLMVDRAKQYNDIDECLISHLTYSDELTLQIFKDSLHKDRLQRLGEVIRRSREEHHNPDLLKTLKGYQDMLRGVAKYDLVGPPTSHSATASVNLTTATSTGAKKCDYCNKKGHIKSNCFKLARDNDKNTKTSKKRKGKKSAKDKNTNNSSTSTPATTSSTTYGQDSDDDAHSGSDVEVARPKKKKKSAHLNST